MGKGTMKKILYVDRNPGSYDDIERSFFHDDKQRHVLEGLKRRYDVDMVYDFLSRRC